MMKYSINLVALVVACIFVVGTPKAFAAVVNGGVCTQLGISSMSDDKTKIVTCLFDDATDTPPMHWHVGGQSGITGYEKWDSCFINPSNQNIQSCHTTHVIPTAVFAPPDDNYTITCAPQSGDGQGHAFSVGANWGCPWACQFFYVYSTIQWDNTPESNPGHIACVYHHN